MVRQGALVVEDSDVLLQVLARMLEGQGFDVARAATGELGIALARERRPDLILLDVSLPDTDGFEVCRRVREFSDAYIVMVSARDQESDKVHGLMAGADDYVTKPFSPRELTARIQALGRRPRTHQQTSRQFGELLIDTDSREVSLSGRPLQLTKIEFDLLDLLSSSPHLIHTRAEVLGHVWGESWINDDHVLDVHLGNLRRKLGETASAPRYIHTVRGVGYRFEP